MTGVVIKHNKHGALASVEEGVAGLVHISEFENEDKLREALELGKSYSFTITLFEPKDQRMTLSYQQANEPQETEIVDTEAPPPPEEVSLVPTHQDRQPLDDSVGENKKGDVKITPHEDTTEKSSTDENKVKDEAKTKKEDAGEEADKKEGVQDKENE